MRYILRISYDGSNYSGYQRQKDKVTIQETLENVLKVVLRQDVSIVASGRTDAGVSAIEQVCHIDIDDMNVKNAKGYINNLLPHDIRVLSIEEADSEFHARYSAKRKTYEYLFYVSNVENPVYENVATKIGYNIDISSMKESCQYFIGEHNFSAFCASNTEVKDKTRIIYNMDITEISDGLYKLEITGNGFLYNMVRIIMGTLISVGMGKISSQDINKIIASKDRQKSGKTAPSKGLYLKKVVYK